MSKPQVTITLGRSGQVVKRPRNIPGSGGAVTNSQPLSGSKRSMTERFKSNADNSMLSMNKRLRADLITRTPGHGMGGARVGQNDLRLKLMRKRISRRIQHEVEERKKMDIREKMSRNIQSPGGPEWSFSRHTLPKNRSGDLLPADSLGRSYSSRTFDGLMPRSPDRVLKVSRGILPPRNIDEVRQLPSRPIDASRTGQILHGELLRSSRPRGPAPLTVRASVDADKPVTGLPPASGSMPKSSYLGELPLTVDSLLHSLGLGKYAVLFQAEEVDMAALKQMGDRDLKELGIPMGPRKKILLAILPHSKRQPCVTTT